VHTWGEQRGLSERWRQTKQELEQEGVVLITFKEMLIRIVEAISQWREKYRGKTQQSSLPSNLWLLKMLEALLLSGKLNVSGS